MLYSMTWQRSYSGYLCAGQVYSPLHRFQFRTYLDAFLHASHAELLV